MLFVQMLASLAAQSAGLFFGAALNLSASVTAAAIFTLAAQLLGGYLANNVPPYLKTLSLVYHGYRNMQLLEFNIGEGVLCAKTEASRFEGCPTFGNGTLDVAAALANLDPSIDYFIPTKDLLSRDGLNWLPYWTSTLFLVAFFIFFRVLGYISLRRSL